MNFEWKHLGYFRINNTRIFNKKKFKNFELDIWINKWCFYQRKHC